MTLRAGYKCGCGRTIEVVVKEYTEAPRPQAESDSTACFGAGCPEVEQEPLGVSGPAQILAKLKIEIQEWWDFTKRSDLAHGRGYLADIAFGNILKRLENYEGTEPQDAA